ncbi:MAG TPA: class I SAM-dependent methyltransferase [Gemmatimonadota bacterium]|nr:class I SAM-dependent methyltransferase [Gemmatimonadota bacterium]
MGLIHKLTPLAWSNRLSRSVTRKAVDLAYLARHYRGPTKRLDPTLADAAALAPLARYRAEYERLNGWLRTEAAATWSCLFTFQEERGIHGDLMEIGIFKGKSAALIALHAGPQEKVVLVDPMLRREATDAIQNIGISGEVVFVRDFSENLAGHPQVMSRSGRFRWIHVDGEHSLRAVANDLRLSSQLLAKDGVICLDDFMNSCYPQVTIAALRFLERLEGEFTLFLSGFNKGYVCRTAAAGPYLEYLRDRLLDDLEQRDIGEVMVCKTTDPDELNCFGLVPRKRQFRYRGPDWAPDRIRI